jgi:hypothetical protein
VIERDYVVQPRCPETLGGEMRCTLAAGHAGKKHPLTLPDGSPIYFENLVDNSTGNG